MYKITKINLLLLCLLLCLVNLESLAQSSSFGNTFVPAGGETAVHNNQHDFQVGGTGVLPGLVGTERTSPMGYLSFVGTATWINASNSAHVDGYVRSYKTSSFIFPIGDNGVYRPAGVSVASFTAPTDAAYFAVNPTNAITTSLKGGNEPALPSGGPFNTSSLGTGISAIDNLEYWDINGTTPAKITLTWNTTSAVGTLTGNSLANLTIVGWDGSKWVEVPSTFDATSVLGGSSTLTAGSITTDATITPNSYSVYTLGSAAPASVKLQLKVFLQGAFFSPSGATDVLMRDNLRTLSVFPTTEPFTAMASTRFTKVADAGGQQTNSSILAVSGNDAIVDWVFVELRDASNPATVVKTRAALVQKDGDVVESSDGTTPVTFDGGVGTSYYVAVKHRNHLGAMTANAIQMAATGTIVDFTSMTATQTWDKGLVLSDNSLGSYDGSEQVQLGNGKMGLWAGNARNSDAKVKYSGSLPDNPAILSQVITYSSNSSGLYNYDFVTPVYLSGDINLDGKVKYVGSSSDTAFILFNIVNKYPVNITAKLYNFDFMVEQIP